MNPPCPICAFEPKESFLGKHLEVLKCGNSDCGHLYAARAPADHGVQRHLDPRKEWNVYWDRNRRLVRFWAEQGFLHSGSRVLDFGAGSGHISAAIREFLGIGAITCIEADYASHEWLRRNGLQVAMNLDACPADYTAVLLVELIEHVDEPVALLTTLKQHMGRGGKLFLSTPCGETRSGSRATNAYDTPEHVHFFTENSLRLALSMAGFANMRLMSVPQMYPRAPGTVGAIAAAARSAARAARNRFHGYSHLVALVD